MNEATRQFHIEAYRAILAAWIADMENAAEEERRTLRDRENAPEDIARSREVIAGFRFERDVARMLLRNLDPCELGQFLNRVSPQNSKRIEGKLALLGYAYDALIEEK